MFNLSKTIGKKKKEYHFPSKDMISFHIKQLKSVNNDKPPHGWRACQLAGHTGPKIEQFSADHV